MSAEASKGKADSLVEQANKKLKSWSLFNSSKFDEAAELLEKAANNYKLAKAWKEAADTYKQLAEIQIKLGSQHEAASAYVEASRALTKTESDDAVVVLHQAVEIYTDMGRLNQAARYIRDIAEQLEKQESFDAAVEFYTKAADLFMTEDSTSEANKCRLKIAEFVAKSGEYSRAAEIFEDIARQAAEHNLLKYSAKNYLLNAGLCRLCYADVESLPATIDRYREIDITFASSRECNLLENIATALEAGDEQAFSDVVTQYDSLSKLDNWRTSILLAVKHRVVEGNVGDGEGDDDLT